METKDRQRLEALRAIFQMAPPGGDIVEIGVASGASFRCWGGFMRGGKLFGFDTFAGFQSFDPVDGPESPAIGKRIGGETELRPRPVTFREVLESTEHAANREKWKCQWALVVGQAEVVLPVVLTSVDLRPSIVFCDADIYAPTEAALRLLWPRLLPGGIFVFDEYGHEAWPGETKAADDFAKANGLTIEKLNLGAYAPEALLRKPL